MAGTTESIGDTIDNYYWLVKTNASGNLEWSQIYANEGFEHARSLVKASDGGYVIAGRSADAFWLVKTDENGIVPEYSSLLIPALVLTATAFILINKKRLLHKRT